MFARADFIVSGEDDAVGSDATVGTSSRLWAFDSGMHSAQTPDETMLNGKRAPSSLKQKEMLAISLLPLFLALPVS